MKAKTKTKTKKANRILLRGTIHLPGSIFFRQFVGEAQGGGKSYEMSSTVSGGIPLVRSVQTGKTFSLPWEDIIAMAREAGIDS